MLKSYSAHGNKFFFENNYQLGIYVIFVDTKH